MNGCLSSAAGALLAVITAAFLTLSASQSAPPQGIDGIFVDAGRVRDIRFTRNQIP